MLLSRKGSAQVNFSSEHGDEENDREPSEEPSVLDDEKHHVCLDVPPVLHSDGIHLRKLREEY